MYSCKCCHGPGLMVHGCFCVETTCNLLLGSSSPILSLVEMAALPAPTPITEWPDYNTNPAGGDPMTTDLNAPYDKGDLCWMLVSTVLCWSALVLLAVLLHPC